MNMNDSNIDKIDSDHIPDVVSNNAFVHNITRLIMQLQDDLN